MRLTTKIKLIIQKKIPNNLFLLVLNFYRYVQKNLFEKYYNFKLNNINNFKNKLTKNLTYKNINYKLVLDPTNGLLDNNIYKNGPYEPEILNQFMDNVKLGDVCLDVGANIGHHSIFLAKLVGEKGKVVAFEPIPKLSSQINESKKENKLENLKIINSALGEKNYDTVIYINKHVMGSSSILEKRYGQEVEKVDIKVEKLDDIFTSLKINKIDFMKIDVEGYEYFVLEGAKETITKYKPKIVIEYSPEYYRQNKMTHVDDIINFLKENKYSIFDIENNNKEVLSDVEFKKDFGENLRSQTNLLCIVKEI